MTKELRCYNGTLVTGTPARFFSSTPELMPTVDDIPTVGIGLYLPLMLDFRDDDCDCDEDEDAGCFLAGSGLTYLVPWNYEGGPALDPEPPRFI